MDVLNAPLATSGAPQAGGGGMSGGLADTLREPLYKVSLKNVLYYELRVDPPHTRPLRTQATRRASVATMGVGDYLGVKVHAACRPTVVSGLAALVRKTPSWPRSWANFSLLIAVFPQECTGRLAYFGST